MGHHANARPLAGNSHGVSPVVGTLADMAEPVHQARRPPVLSHRTLNRTLLARQQLLAREPGRAADLIDRLVGLQAQAPLAPYVALWSRLEGFAAAELGALMSSRAYVRGHAMRSTIHLLSAADFPPLRALSEPAVARNLTAATFAGHLHGADLPGIAADLREQLTGGPLPRRRLVDRLSVSWGPQLAAAAGSAAAVLTPCVQATPRGVWGHNGPVAWATVEQWLGARLPEPVPSPAGFLLRYLAAFGPASVADMRSWSGWTGLRAVVDGLRPQLRALRDEEGHELLDLPDAPVADPDTPAAVRFLPEYDNVHFAFAHRARINPHGHRVPLAPGNGAAMGTLLADGVFAGVWRRNRDSDGSSAALTVTPFGALDGPIVAQTHQEANALLAFLAPGADAIVRVTPGDRPA